MKGKFETFTSHILFQYSNLVSRGIGPGPHSLLCTSDCRWSSDSSLAVKLCAGLEFFVLDESHRTLCNADTTAAWKRGRRGSYVRRAVQGRWWSNPRLNEGGTKEFKNAGLMLEVRGTYQDGLRELRVSSIRAKMLPNRCPPYALATHTVSAGAGITRETPPVCFSLLQFPQLEMLRIPRIIAFHCGTYAPCALAHCLM